MRYKDGINVGFSRGLKGKWKKSRINQNSTAVVFFAVLLHWRCRDCVWGTVFFSNIFLYFSSLELFSLSLSLDSIFMCVRVFFFSKRSKVRPRLGQWSVAGLVSLLLAFFRTLRVILFFFYSPNSLGFFFPNFFQFQRSWCDQVGRSSRRCHGNHWWRVPWGTQWSYPASILIGAFSEDVAVWFYEHFTDCVSSLLVMSVACDDHQKGYRCDFRNDSVVGTVLTVRLRAVERDFSPAANLGLWWRRRDGEGIVSTPFTSGEVNGVAQKLDETRARRWIRGYTR